MSRIKLNSIKFPNLADNYVVPELFINDPNNDGNVEIFFDIIPTFTFYISGNGFITTESEYQAELGMTWEDWVNSSYNTLGLSINYGYLQVPGGYIMWDSNQDMQQGSYLIKEGETYEVSY